jgi:pimeloyl-ACP methyl ester carboxylesterase
MDASTAADARTIALPDGRRLAYAEYGDPDGKPVFYFHGTPGSRLERHPDASIARERGARLITVDRPGYGQSAFQVDRTFLDWPADVSRLADTLGLDRFAVCGWSGGTPHVLACAFKLPARLTRVAVFSGAAPFDVPGVLDGMAPGERAEFAVARGLPWGLAREVWRPIAGLFTDDTGRAYDEFLGQLQGHERAEFAAPAVRQMLTASIAEAYRQGGDGEAWEDRLLAAAWGFGPTDVMVPVYTWHGTADTLAPPAMGRALANSLRQGHPTWCEGEGHALWFQHWPEMLDVLLA